MKDLITIKPRIRVYNYFSYYKKEFTCCVWHFPRGAPQTFNLVVVYSGAVNRDSRGGTVLLRNTLSYTEAIVIKETWNRST